MQVYIFNLAEEVVAVMDSDKKEIYKAIHHRRINPESTGDDNYFELDIPAAIDQADYLIEGNYIGFIDIDDNFQMFRITRYRDIDDGGKLYREIFAPHVVYELRDSIVEDKKPRSISAETAISNILSTEAIATRWSTGTVDNFGSNNINFYYQSAWSALLKMRERWAYIDDNGLTQYGVINPRLVFTGTSISARYIDFEKELGTFRGKAFTIDRDIKTLTRDIDISEVATALYAFGKGEEIEQETDAADSTAGGVAYGKRITIEDETWVKADSDLLNPDFEDGLTNWTTLIGTAVVETSFSNVGTQCIKLSTNSGIESLNVAVTVGKTYNTRCVAYATTSGVYGNVNIKWYDSVDSLISYEVKYILLTPNTWTLLKVEDTAPAGAVNCRIAIGNAAGSSSYMYVDKARVGDYVDKPNGQAWIEDSDAKATWGYADGTRNIFKKYINGDTTDTSILIQQAWFALQKLKEPKVSYEMDVMDLEILNPDVESDKTRLGDNVYIQDFNFNPSLNIYGRVNEIQRDYLFPEDTKIVISNFFEESLNSMITADEVKETEDTNSGIWNKGTLYEDTPQGNTRMRLVEVESGEYASELRYEDDEGNLVGYFNSNEFEYNEIYGGSVFSQNVINTTTESVTYYIDSDSGDDLDTGLTSGTAWKSFNRAMRAVPKILQHDITINVTGSAIFQEDILIEGLLGKGLLKIEADSGVVINGGFEIQSCQAPVYIRGNNNTSASTYLQIHSVVAGIPPFRIYNSQKVRLYFVWANANNFTATDACYCNASNVILQDSCFANGSATGNAGIKSLDMSNVYIEDCYGSNNYYGVYALSAGHIGIVNTFPNANISTQQTDNASNITDKGTATATASPYSVSNPSQQYYTTCIASNSRTFDLQLVSWNLDDYYVRQGQVNSTSGNNYGFMFFNNTTFASLSGKTIYNAVLYIKRQTGGIASARELTFYKHNYLGEPSEGTGQDAPADGTVPTIGTNYGTIASIKWQEELSFLLPSQFRTDVNGGTVDGLLIYDSDGYPYVRLDGQDEYEIKVVFRTS